MDDDELLRRLRRLPDARFDEALALCAGAGLRAHLPPDKTPRSSREIELVRLAANNASVRERLVTHLGGDDPVGAWVEWGHRHYSKLPVLGFRHGVELSLADVFVQLMVQCLPHERAHPHERMEMPETHTVTPADALKLAAERNMAGVVLLGTPGSGKTTLLKHLYTRVAAGEAHLLGMPPETVPVFIRLAELPAAALKSDGLREVILTEAEAHGHRPAADALRVSKRPYLVLLDGLDEVRDEATRVRVCRWLEGEIDHLPDARFAVTCRYAAWQRKTTLNNRFLQVDVLTLDDERVGLYVGRWFQAVVRGLRGGRDVSLDACDREAKEGAEGLVEVLFRTERTARMKLLELTRNPLLLSTICLVYYKRKKLPKQRDELYGQCVELLVETWSAAARAAPSPTTRRASCSNRSRGRCTSACPRASAPWSRSRTRRSSPSSPAPWSTCAGSTSASPSFSTGCATSAACS